MRVNVYAEELSDKPEDTEIVVKEADGIKFTGLRLYLYLPVTKAGRQIRGKFMHRDGDDDSSAITIWGKKDLRTILKNMLAKLNEHYKSQKEKLPLEELKSQAPKIRLGIWRHTKTNTEYEVKGLCFNAVMQEWDVLYIPYPFVNVYFSRSYREFIHSFKFVKK